MPEVDYDVEALSASIAGELFAQEEQVEAPGSQEGVPEVPPGAKDPVPPVEKVIDPVAQLAALDAEFPLPKSWKKDSEEVWKTIPKSAREIVHKREADISRGIQAYHQGYSNWEAVLKPFAPILSAQPDINPVQLLQNVMTNHINLLRGTPEQKVVLAKQLLASYGISLDGTALAAPPPVDPQVLSRINGLESTLQATLLAEKEKEVSSFFSDPKNEFANEVATEIQSLLASRQATDLKSAYDMAVWLNPEVRAKIITKQGEKVKADSEAEEAARKRVAKGNRNSSVGTSVPAPRKGTMDDTINSVLSKHYPDLH